MTPLLPFLLMAFPPRPILDLWPAGPPDGWRRTDKEIIERDEKAGFSFVRNVSHPTLEIFRAAKPKPHAPTVMVCPGGGYYVEAFEHEGNEIAARLNAGGFNAAVLKYRLPNFDSDKPLYKPALQDAQRALRLLRRHAAEYGFDAEKIGIMGFSVGGHLAAAASNTPRATYEAQDSADSLSCRPAFAVLVYPSDLDTGGKPQLPPEITVALGAPPAFVTQAMDDHDFVVSSFSYALACQAANVPVEFHLWPKGGHGFGLRTKEPGVSGWIDLLIAWLRRR
jgi:acetyl esterase/lipase